MGIFKKDYIIGLDLGASSVKLVQFIIKEDGFHLVKAATKEIASAEDNAGRQSEYVSALKDLFKGIDRGKSKIITTINCSMTSMKKATLPHMPRKELREALNLKAKDYFHFDTGNAVLDFDILGETAEEGVRKYNLAVAASPRMSIDMHLGLLDKAGVKTASIVPCSYALKEFAGLSQAEKGKTKGFVDIGEYYTELLIFEGRELVFSRKIPVAGSDLTKAMTGVLVSDRGKTQLSLAEAEKIKREVGIPQEGESRMIENKISTTQVLSMLRSPLEQLINEMDRCFDYYREESRGRTVDSLVLVGGGACLKGLTEFLSRELDIEVKLCTSLKGAKIESGAAITSAQICRFAMAIGAAFTGGRGINLLPPERKGEKKRVAKRTTVEVFATTTALILAFIYIGMRIEVGNLHKKISVARAELSSLRPQLDNLKAQSVVSKITASEPYWGDVFKELSNIIPGDIYLTALSNRNKIIEIKGLIVSERGEEALSGFIFILEKSIFKNVKLVGTEHLKEKSANEFTLRCQTD